ncbi:MAG: RHS repeat-associated core domain-containing protein, partial [Runella slithyformis]
TAAKYVGKTPENYDLQKVEYDANGNITTLWQNGLTGVNTFGAIDQLSYSYAAHSNKLQSVADAISGNADVGDFRAGGNSSTGYDYWLDGSLKQDLNKGITNIAYNHLALTTQITTTNGNIQTFYDGGGGKLRKIVNGVTTDYLGEIILVNDQIYQLTHGEGRALPNGTDWALEFSYSDHLGNSRLSFRDSLAGAQNGVYAPPIITQINAYSDFGFPLKGLDFSRGNQANKFTFNGKELEESIGWHDFGFRHLDPTIGRWTQQDPLAELGSDVSPYIGFFNNPTAFFDPDGRWPDEFKTPGEEWMAKNGLASEAKKNPSLERVLNQLYINTPKGQNAHYEMSYSGGYLNFFEDQTQDFFGVGYSQYWYRKGRIHVGASSSDVMWGGVHGTMDMIGMTPVIGEFFDGINGFLYALRGHYGEAILSFGAMIPFIGNYKVAKRLNLPVEIHHFGTN